MPRAKNTKKPMADKKGMKPAPAARVYVIEAVEDERFNEKKGRQELKIRWVGYKRVTWESRDSFTKQQPEMVAQFDAERRRKAVVHKPAPKQAFARQTTATGRATKRTATKRSGAVGSSAVEGPTAVKKARQTATCEEAQGRETTHQKSVGAHSSRGIAAAAGAADIVADDDETDDDEPIEIVAETAFGPTVRGSTSAAGANNNFGQMLVLPSILKRRGVPPKEPTRAVQFYPETKAANAPPSLALVQRSPAPMALCLPTTSFAAVMKRVYGEWHKRLNAIDALCAAKDFSSAPWTLERAEFFLQVLISESCAFSEAACATGKQLEMQRRTGRR